MGGRAAVAMSKRHPRGRGCRRTSNSVMGRRSPARGPHTGRFASATVATAVGPEEPRDGCLDEDPGLLSFRWPTAQAGAGSRATALSSPREPAALRRSACRWEHRRDIGRALARSAPRSGPTRAGRRRGIHRGAHRGWRPARVRRSPGAVAGRSAGRHGIELPPRADQGPQAGTVDAADEQRPDGVLQAAFAASAPSASERPSRSRSFPMNAIPRRALRKRRS